FNLAVELLEHGAKFLEFLMPSLSHLGSLRSRTSGLSLGLISLYGSLKLLTKCFNAAQQLRPIANPFRRNVILLHNGVGHLHPLWNKGIALEIKRLPLAR